MARASLLPGEVLHGLLRRRRSGRSGGSRRSRRSSAVSSSRSCSIVLPSYLWVVMLLASSTTRRHHLSILPATIFSRTFSGLSAASCSRRATRPPALLGGTSSASRRHGRGGRGDLQRDIAGEGDEVLVLGDEVGLAVDLDQHADLAVGVDVGLDRALGGRRARRSWIFLPCLTRRISIALSMSPSASVSAFLQSIIPAPVRSRRALTSFAAISVCAHCSALRCSGCVASARLGCSAAAAGWLRRGGGSRLGGGCGLAPERRRCSAGADGGCAGLGGRCRARRLPARGRRCSCGQPAAGRQPPARRPLAAVCSRCGLAPAPLPRRAPCPRPPLWRLPPRPRAWPAPRPRAGRAPRPRPWLAPRPPCGPRSSSARKTRWPSATTSPIAWVISGARADRVVVAGDHEVDAVGVAVGVDQADDRDPQARASLTAIASVLRSIDEHRVGDALHVLDAAEVRPQLREVGLGGHPLAGRQQRQLALGLVALEVVQALDALVDRLEVGQQTTEPAVVDVRHAGRLGDLLDGVAGLLLGARRTARCRRGGRACSANSCACASSACGLAADR